MRKDMPQKIKRENIALGLARSTGRRPAATALSPATAGMTVAGLWGGFAAAINYLRYRRNEISGREAVASTASESVGAGIASSLGLIASNVARAALLATSVASPASFAVGFLVTTSSKIIWDRATSSLVRPGLPQKR
jgi:hypothetical protein